MPYCVDVKRVVLLHVQFCQCKCIQFDEMFGFFFFFLILILGTRIPAAAMDVLDAVQNGDPGQKTTA